MPFSPDEDLVTAIDTATTLTAGTNLFSSVPRAASARIPQRAVFVWCLPGGTIDNYCQGGARSPQHYHTSCRVVVRSNAHSYDDGRDLARLIRDGIHDAPPSGYISTRVRTSEPDYYGTDDVGSHLFGFDVDMQYSA